MNGKKVWILAIAMLLLSSTALAYNGYYNSNFGYGDAFYLREANQPTGTYGAFGGPGNAYYRGQPLLTARYSRGYTDERYGMSELRTPAPAAFSPGYSPRYGVTRGGVNGGFAFSPGYTDQRYGLPLSQNDGFAFSPGYYPRYGMMNYDGARYVNSRPRALYVR